jgi:nitroreductase
MILDVIKNRRSVTPPLYIDKPISREAIEQVLEAANYAPTHKKTEPWRFKVITGDKLTELGVFLSNKYEETTEHVKANVTQRLLTNPQKAGAIIAICMQRDPKQSLPEWEELASVAMAVQNMWLTASDLGIGSFWSSPRFIEYFGEFTPLAEGERCIGFFYMGHYEAELPVYERGSIAEKVQWL